MRTISEFFMTFLLNAVWQAALITLAAVLCSWLLRRTSARYGYFLWASALFLSLLVPVLSALLVYKGAAIDDQALQLPLPPVVLSLESSRVPLDISARMNAAAPTPGTLSIPIAMNLALWLFAAYLLFVSYRAAGLFRSWIRTRAIVRTAYHAPLTENICWALARCGAVLTRQTVEVLFSAAVPVPVTIGNRRPVVLLPEQFLDESDRDVVLTAIGHEMVHIERRDYTINLFFQILSLPLSFHPAVAYAKRRMAHARELCCDEIVATRLLKAEAYALSLLNIAGSASSLGRMSAIITVGITDTDNLEVRIMSLLKRSELSMRKKIFLLFTAALVLTAPIAAATYLSPRVEVASAASGPMAQPTPGDRDPADAELVARVEKLRAQLLKAAEALKNSNLSQEKREEYSELQTKYQQAVDDYEANSKTVRARRARLEWTLAELENGSLTKNPEAYARIKETLESELENINSGAEPPEIDLTNMSIVLTGEKDEADRLGKALHAAEPKISLKQAVEIGLAQQPGVVVDKGLGLDRDGTVVYKLYIRDNDGNASWVIVNAMDGSVTRIEKRN